MINECFPRVFPTFAFPLEWGLEGINEIELNFLFIYNE